LVLGRILGNLDSQNSPRPGLGGSHHLPPYSILYVSSRGPHPNDILSWDSQVGVPKLPKLRFLRLWGPITSRADLRLKCGLNKNCNCRWELSNSMSHAICTQVNRVYSWLLAVGSQIGNLTPSLSFGHNLCFRCPNGWCEPILDIYVSISFWWYKELFNPLGFDPCDRSLNIQKFTGISTSKVGVPLGVWGPILSHSLALPGASGMTLRLPSWPVTLQPFTLVANPKLGLQH